MIRKLVSPIMADDNLEKRNVFVGEAFGPPNVRVVFAGAAEDTQEREDRVFLLMGPSCVREEKATCIDAFCNFFYDVQKEDNYRLHIANEKFDKTTPNKAIVTYVFNDSKMPFRPIVVDVKDDDASLLHKWLSENARLRIDVVCIVFNLLGRIETRHETAIKEMLSILPKRIRSSASVLLTNSDGNPPPVALLRRFDLEEAPVYKLNWTTLFTGRPDDSLKELLRANYWNMSEKSLKDMISRMQTIHPQTFNGLPHEPPLFALHLRPDNASSSASSSSSTSTSTFIERRRTQHTTTTQHHHHYDLPPAMDPVQGLPEPSPPLVKTTIFQTTSKHVEDKIVDGPPSGIPKELLKQIEQRATSDEHSGEKKVVVEKTITVKMVKKDDKEDATVIDRARARSLERIALEEKQRRTEEEEELAKIKDQLERERREREAVELRIREHEQSEAARRARQEEERLLLLKIEEERREKHRVEQLAFEERARKDVDDRARKLSEERREMEAERRRLEEERRRLEGRKQEELKKLEEERSRLDEERRVLLLDKSTTAAERRRLEEELRESERRRKEEEELRRRKEEEEVRKRREEEEELRRRREEDAMKRRMEEEKELEELKRRREIQRKAREEEEKERLELQRRREREEAERKRKSAEEKNITITYERTVERTRTEEIDERVLDPLANTAYMTRTYLNGDIPRLEHRHDVESPIGDAPIVRFVFDESTRSYIHHLVDPPRHTLREDPADLRILSRTETLIDDPFYGEDDNGFTRHSPERVGHHRMSSPTREERYQHVRGPTDLRSPGIAATPASPEMIRRDAALRRTNQDVQRDSYPSGRESRKRERTQYENLPMDDEGNSYIIPDRMRHSKSPIIMRVKMSPKENAHQTAVGPALPPVQREQPLQSTPATIAEHSPPPLYQRTPPANATLPQRGTPSVHFAAAVGAGAKPVGAGAGIGSGAAPGDQYTAIQRPPPTPAIRSNKPSPIARVLTPPPSSMSPSQTAPPYVRPPRQLGDDELLSPAGKALVYGIDRPGQLLPPPPPPIHKHPQPPRAPLARPEDAHGANRRPPGVMSEEEEREYLLRLRPLDEYNRLPNDAEKGYRPQDASWSSKPRPVETSTPENERKKKKGCCAAWFVVFDKERTRPLDCWDWVLPICCFCIAPVVVILIVIGIILTYALN